MTESYDILICSQSASCNLSGTCARALNQDELIDAQAMRMFISTESFHKEDDGTCNFFLERNCKNQDQPLY